MTIKTTKGTWKIFGISLTPSDSIFIKLKNAIESGNLNQSYLQKETGHLLPINVDHSTREIVFSNF